MIRCHLFTLSFQRWYDEYLTWNATEFDDVKTIRIPANQIWTPDLVIQNLYVHIIILS